MSFLAESVSKVVQPAREVLLNEAGVSALHVPIEATNLARPGAFGMELRDLQPGSVGFDVAAGFVVVQTASNIRRLQGLVGELVAVAAKDSQGSDGVFPGIILPAGKGAEAGKLRVGILHGAPGKDRAGAWHGGDRLAAGGVPTGDQAFFLRRMLVTESPGVGAHNANRVDLGDMADLGVSMGMLMNKTWQQDPHGKAHQLAGNQTLAGTGLSEGLSVGAGLTSIDRFRPQKVVTPDKLLWNPAFGGVQSSLPHLAGYSEADLTMATGYAVIAKTYGPGKVQSVLAAGIAAMKASGI